jgi:hypothetical protein
MKNKLRKIPVISKLNTYLVVSLPDFSLADTAMNNYSQLESVLLAVQLRHLDFFEEDQTLIIDYVTIGEIDDDTYELITLRTLPGEILDDLNAAMLN